MNRTNTCGDLRIGDVNHEVILQGWVKKVRKLGGMTFVDLRDRYGYTQLLISDEHKDLLETLKPETVLEVKGVVHERKTKNPNIPTGEIEVAVDTIEVINKAETLPFPIENEITTLWDTRLKYRYLDLRREVVQKNFILRSKINHLVRNYLVENNFLEIETPFFAKSTPEGARDFLVPSRLNPNKFYALPQSPQLFKQLLMVAGFDRYFQIVRCFRDEDLRVDRELEFTQLDLEMSFAHGNDVMDLVEKLLKMILKEVDETFTDEPLAKITYAEAIEKYGSDKPDLRFDLPIQTVTAIFQNSTNKLIQEILANDKNVLRGIAVQQLLNKSQLTQLEEIAKQFNFPGILFVKFENDQWTGSLASTLSDEEKTSLKTEFNLSNNPATIILNGGEYAKVSQLFGALRNALGKMFNLYQTKFKPLWVVDFPLFEWSEEEQRFVAAHHPFTMPKPESLADFDTNKASALATAYDLVMNGFELGSGSERITDPQLQQRMFDAVGLDATQVEQNFGWFVKAYQYGAPYHAGMGLGLDRILMLLTNSENIRDVIAFPKNLSGIDPMSGSPDTVSEHQLEELHLQLVPKKDHQ